MLTDVSKLTTKPLRTMLRDIPRELRDKIYDFYIQDADKTTIWVAPERYLPPALALVNHQLRAEFLSMWDARRVRPLDTTTRHINIAVFDIDFRLATSVWEKAFDLTRYTDHKLESVCITFVFTDSWDASRARASVLDFVEWCEVHARPICAYDRLHWRVLDHRSFCRLRQAFFFASVVRSMPLWRQWRYNRFRDILNSIVFSLRMLWNGKAHGVASA